MQKHTALFLQTLRNFLPAFLLWKLRIAEKVYRLPAVFTGGDAFMTAVLSILEDYILPDTSAATVLLFVLTLPNVAVRCCTTHLLYNAHAQTLDSVDPNLAVRWRKLRKWSIGLLITVTCTPFLIFFGNIAVLAAFGAVIGNTVTRILNLIYLHRTAKNFQTLAESPLDE